MYCVCGSEDVDFEGAASAHGVNSCSSFRSVVIDMKNNNLMF